MEGKKMNQRLYDEFLKEIPKENIWIDEPMKKHTTFRVGGAADFFVVPESVEELGHAVVTCKVCEVPYYIMGNGSNLLVSDQGYRGVVIQVYKQMSKIEISENILTVQAGASLAKVAGAALEAGLEGFEFAAGIPGTLGGACVMNAGAYGGEMKDVLLDVTVLDAEGKLQSLAAEQLELGYRTSVIAKNESIVLEARVRLNKGNSADIKAKMGQLKAQRISKQPLEFPSAGSTFKRPEGYFAGKLIQDAGLCGFAIGGAQVSEKHCGFVINRGNATAKEIKQLIETVSEKVKEQFGVVLETEVKILGDF